MRVIQQLINEAVYCLLYCYGRQIVLLLILVQVASKPEFRMQIGEHDSQMYGSITLMTCQNCSHRFPPDKIDLHEAYCVRNYKKCHLCGVMVDRNVYESHQVSCPLLQQQAHESRECEYCKEKYTGRELELHQQECYAKPELCEYCMKTCPKAQLENHKKMCGMRNKQCTLCKKPIPLKQYEGHLKRCQNRKKEREDRERRQISEESRNIRANQGQSQRELGRQNSANRLDIQHLSAKQEKKEKQLKGNKVKPRNFIERYQIKQPIDPVPISIQLTIKNKQQIMQQKLEQKNNEYKHHHQKHK